MKEHIDYLSTLFVGIDIASRVHVISALDFNAQFYIKMKPVENTQQGAALIEQMISDVLEHNLQFKFVIIGMEATGFYGVHLANYLSASNLLAPFSVRVYCLNPKEVKNYKKSFNDIGKNDGIDSYVIADFARVGRIQPNPGVVPNTLLYSVLPDTACISLNVLQEKKLTCLTTSISSSVNTLCFAMAVIHSLTNTVQLLKPFLLSTQLMKIS